MLDRRHHDVAPPRIRERDALDGEVVGLGAAAREHDVSGAASDDRGHVGARGRERAGRLVAESVPARRVAERTREEGPHRLERLPAHRGGRGVVEEDHRCSVVARGGIRRLPRARRDDHVEPEVERTRRVRERADRDHVDAGGRDRPDRVERDATGCLDHGPPGDELDARPQVVDREVVEHDRVRSAGEHGVDLVEPVDLDLEVGGVRHPLACCAQRGREVLPARGEHGEVIVLGHHGVGERAPVVAPAAVAHGLALEAAQARASSCGCRRCARAVPATAAT